VVDQVLRQLVAVHGKKRRNLSVGVVEKRNREREREEREERREPCDDVE